MRFSHVLSTIRRSNMTTQAIDNIIYQSCVNCKHYIPSLISDELPKCKFFGYKDITTKIITNHYTNICRDSNDMCGKEAHYFRQSQLNNSKM